MAEAPKVRTRLWSQEVKEADPTPEEKPTYEFSNGRRFTETRSSNDNAKPVDPATSE
jgi:hypothetical protein